MDSAPSVVTSAPGQGQALFPIQGRSAQSLADSLKGLYPRVQFRVDELLNVSLAEGTPADLEQIRRVLSVVSEP